MTPSHWRRALLMLDMHALNALSTYTLHVCSDNTTVGGVAWWLAAFVA